MKTGVVSQWPAARSNVPWMTFALSVLCLMVRVVLVFLTPLEQAVVVEFGGASPAAVHAALPGGFGHMPEVRLLTTVTGLFIHSSWLHLGGNLVYLWVFGIPVERRLGSVSLGLIFILGGALANVVVALQQPQLAVPVIGASGAVSAVVGAYLALFPSRRIEMLLPLGLYLQFARVPALLVIGSWFTLQLVYSVFGPITTAVAWWTHLAGFVLGLISAFLALALAQFRSV